MAKTFAITTTATEPLRADAKSHAEAGFTVTNTTSRPMRGLAKARPLGDTKQQWLTVQGETERDFAPRASQEFTVSFDGPATEPASATPAGGTAPPVGAIAAPVAKKYPFRLDVASALNPDEDFTDGPTVTVEMVPRPVIPPNGKLPRWIIFVILGVLLLVGVIVLVVVLASGGKSSGNQASASSPSFAPAGNFGGHWTNADLNTNGITRLIIDQNRSMLVVRAFGRCHPEDCDWGPANSQAIGNASGVIFYKRLLTTTVVLTLQGENKLKAVEDNSFHDGRTPQHREYVFNRVP